MRPTVKYHDRERACAGLNLYVPYQYVPEALLFDMDGRIVQKFSRRHPEERDDFRGWAIIEPRPDGSFVVAAKDLLAINWNSDLLWEIKGYFFVREIVITPLGDLFAISLHSTELEGTTVADPLILRITEHGEVLQRLSLLQVLLSNESIAEHLRRGLAADVDVLQIGGLALANCDVVASDGQIKCGDLIFSIPKLNLIGALCFRSRRVCWWISSSDFDSPQQVSQTSTGSILFFSNGLIRGHSRALEFDCLRNDIVWQYPRAPAPQIFSSRRGGVQRLHNGNTLIVESTEQRVIEVTPDGDTVWECITETQDKLQKPSALYRLKRIMDWQTLGWPAAKRWVSSP